MAHSHDDCSSSRRMNGHASDRFFIIGCQRSGTTLLRLVLECHSQIKCYDEHMAYRILLGDGSYNEHSQTQHRPITGFKVPFLTEQLVSWAASLPHIANPYAGERLLFMVRDARDTVVSMFNLKMDNLSWFDKCGMPRLLERIERLESFRARYAVPLKRLRLAGQNHIAHAALYWRYKVDAYVEYVNHEFP